MDAIEEPLLDANRQSSAALPQVLPKVLPRQKIRFAYNKSAHGLEPGLRFRDIDPPDPMAALFS